MKDDDAFERFIRESPEHQRALAEVKRLEDLILEGYDAERGLAIGASGMMGAPCMTAELDAEADAIRERRKA